MRDVISLLIDYYGGRGFSESERSLAVYKLMPKIDALAKQRQIAAQNNKRGEAARENLPEQSVGQARDMTPQGSGEKFSFPWSNAVFR
jgi:hypothetical protein